MKFQKVLNEQNRNRGSQILLLVPPPFQNERKYRLGFSFNEILDQHNRLPSRVPLGFGRDFAGQDLLGSFDRDVDVLEHD